MFRVVPKHPSRPCIVNILCRNINALGPHQHRIETAHRNRPARRCLPGGSRGFAPHRALDSSPWPQSADEEDDVQQAENDRHDPLDVAELTKSGPSLGQPALVLVAGTKHGPLVEERFDRKVIRLDLVDDSELRLTQMSVVAQQEPPARSDSDARDGTLLHGQQRRARGLAPQPNNRDESRVHREEERIRDSAPSRDPIGHLHRQLVDLHDPRIGRLGFGQRAPPTSALRLSQVQVYSLSDEVADVGFLDPSL